MSFEAAAAGSTEPGLPYSVDLASANADRRAQNRQLWYIPVSFLVLGVALTALGRFTENPVVLLLGLFLLVPGAFLLWALVFADPDWAVAIAVDASGVRVAYRRRPERGFRWADPALDLYLIDVRPSRGPDRASSNPIWIATRKRLVASAPPDTLDAIVQAAQQNGIRPSTVSGRYDGPLAFGLVISVPSGSTVSSLGGSPRGGTDPPERVGGGRARA